MQYKKQICTAEKEEKLKVRRNKEQCNERVRRGADEEEVEG